MAFRHAYNFLMIKILSKLFIGPRHTSVITKDGSLYTFGAGSWGVLGHGNEKTVNPQAPKKVEFFERKGIKIKDCKLGEYHSIALSEDGDVYTWGYGGKEGYFSWMFSQEVGALGHGNRKPFFIPKKVDFFTELETKVSQISAGLYHCVAVTEDGDLYTWGRGLYGTLGNGSNQYTLTPELNEDFASFKDEGINIVKIDSAEDYTAVLMDNGEVYTFGKNDRGQMGIGTGIGIDMFESSPSPTLVSFEEGDECNISDIYCGQSTMLLKDEFGNAWKTGLRLDYNPKMINLAADSEYDQNVASIACGRKHYVLVNNDNQMFIWGSVFKNNSSVKVDGFDLYYGDDLFEDQKCINLSMKYGLFGAVTESND